MSTKLSGIDLLLNHCASGNEDEVRKAVSNDPVIIHEANSQEQRPLHAAVSNGHLNIVKLLVETEPKEDKLPTVRSSVDATQGIVRHENKDQQTALHVAVSKGYENIVKFLVESGAAADLRDKNVESPLHLAFQIGTPTPEGLSTKDKDKRHNIIKELLESEYIGLGLADAQGRTPLSLAVHVGDVKLVEMMMSKKPETTDIDVADNQGKSPLLHALINGNVSIAEMFLEYIDGNVNKMSNDGYTPLIAACEACNESIVQKLLGHPEINVKLVSDHKQRTALNVAVRKKMSPHIIRQIAEKLVHKDMPGSAQKLMYLIDIAGSPDDLTPLMEAIETNQMDVAQVLIDHDASIDCQDTDLKTALHRATERQNEQLVRWLLESRINVNIVDNKGCTALHVACQIGHTEIAKAIVQRGVDVELEIEDNQGNTPLMLAKEYLDEDGNRIQELCTFLRDYVRSPQKKPKEE